jgi:hypothetical protein
MGNAYDSASLLVTPNGYKASKIYSAKPTDGSGDLAFSRASTAMRRNSAGLWEEVANNVPRLQYPIGGGCPSWLFEPQATNSVNYSNNLSLGWSNLGGNSIIVDTTTPCDLFVAQNGTRLRKNIAEGTQAQFRENTFTPTNGVTYVISFFAKSLVGTNEINIDLVDSPFAAPIPITNTWNRYEATLTATGGSTGLDIGFGSSCALNNEIVICGIQIEVGSVATSPIITAGSAVTRLADSYSRTLSAINQGSAIVKIPDNISVSGGGTHVFGIFILAGTGVGVYLSRTSNGRNRLWIQDATTIFQTTVDDLKLGITWNGTGISVWQNGIKVVTDFSYALTGVINLLSSANLETSNLIDEIVLYNTVLSDTEMGELTTL